MSDYFKAVTDIGFAALVTALGGTPEEADAVRSGMRHHEVPNSPGGLIRAVQAELDNVRRWRGA